MNKQVFFTTIAGLVLVFAFAATFTLAENQADAETTFPSREKVISVIGTATASVDPDLLVITFGMETQEKTAKEALSKNSEAMNSVVNAIMSLGISENEISTSRFNIYPVYENYKDTETDRYTQELVGYKVTNTITTKTSQLDKAADIIDSAVSSGANRVDNVFFTLSPQKQIDIKDDLLGKAVLNAKKKAENALAPLNHKIIGVKAVSLSEFGMPPPTPMYDGAVFNEGITRSSTPVFSSEQDITTTASVIFLIGSN